MSQFNVTFNTTESFNIEFNDISNNFNTSFDKVVKVTKDAYNGDYEFTPSAETQIIEIAHKTATYNITINPIPSNYGLVTWNGTILTIL